jgi:hypothetical protein
LIIYTPTTKKIIIRGVKIMKNNKVSLKKINRANNSTVRTLGACHCQCEGKPWTAFGAGYMGQYL